MSRFFNQLATSALFFIGNFSRSGCVQLCREVVSLDGGIMVPIRLE